MKFKKNILFISIILFAVILAAFLIIKYLKIDNKGINFLIEKNNTDNLNSDTWINYFNDKYRFSLDYPSDLNVSQINNEKIKLADSLGGGYLIINGGASFSQNDGYWIIIVDVLDKDNKANISSLDEWLAIENKKVEHQINVIEERIKIDGYDAIVTYAKSVYNGQEESFKREKKTVFIKDGILFEINTRGIDHERVWNSFKFKKLKLK